MLDVGFDIRPFSTGHRFRGIGRYTAEVLSALAAEQKGIRLHLLGLAGAPDPAADVGAAGFTTVDVPAEQDRLRSVCLDLLRTPGAARAMDVAVMHYNMQVVSPWSPRPFVLTVHDCVPAIYPSRRIFYKDKIYFNIQARAARKADAVITISNASRRDIVRYMGVSPRKVYVTYEACSSDYKPGAPADDLRRLVELPDEYILYVGAADYRKNLKGLVETYGRYAEVSRAPLPLVLTGSREFYRKVRFTWPEGTHGGVVGGTVVFTGFLPERVMPALYGGARAFAFPSLYEGFGLPLLEAMACGTPVIAYDNSSVSEVVGRWGTLIPNGDLNAFVHALVNITTDAALWAEFRELGLERASHFSWSRTAAETADVYLKVARCA